ncbi:MAG TPA: DUF4333 domain-containing protein [Acidimicrobiia bacterium]|nr:DUF4333 domain-containing protein [Acidimicrobiia bacterium]
MLTWPRAAWGAVLVGVLVAVTACSSGPDLLDGARVARAVTSRARLDFPGVPLGPTRCPKAVEKRRGQTFRCTVAVGGQRLRVRVVQRDASGHLQLAAQEAVIQKPTIEQFVGQHASIAATVNCGSSPVLVLAPGAHVACSVSFVDGTMQTVSVRVIDTSGTVAVEAPAK